jgi:hypothetical protein
MYCVAARSCGVVKDVPHRLPASMLAATGWGLRGLYQTYMLINVYVN